MCSSLSGLEKTRAHENSVGSADLGKVALPSAAPQAKQYLQDVHGHLCSQKRLLAKSLHFFITSNNTQIQSRNTLAYICQASHCIQEGSHQKSQKNLYYTQHYFIFFS